MIGTRSTTDDERPRSGMDVRFQETAGGPRASGRSKKTSSGTIEIHGEIHTITTRLRLERLGADERGHRDVMDRLADRARLGRLVLLLLVLVPAAAAGMVRVKRNRSG